MGLHFSGYGFWILDYEILYWLGWVGSVFELYMLSVRRAEWNPWVWGRLSFTCYSFADGERVGN